MRQLYLDLDGVLADFDGRVEQLIGVRPPRRTSAPIPGGFWESLAPYPDIFADLDLLPDARELWDGVKHLRPTILTGLPKGGWPPDAAAHKTAWVHRHFGADVPVICCLSSRKRDHAEPGDVLVDDWSRYKHLWEKKGGIFIVHTSAADSLAKLDPLFRAALV